MYRFNTNHLTLTIAPTLKCNFNCVYCYEDGYRYTTMDKETQDAVIKFVKQYIANISTLTVMWYGGEPLLAIDTIDYLTQEFLKLCGDKVKYTAAMVTNGYNLNKDNVNRLKKLKVKRVQITIDGPKIIHDERRKLSNGKGSFDKIISNIQESYNELSITIRINIDKDNVSSLNKLLGVFEDAGIKNKVPFYLAPVDKINDICYDINCFNSYDFSIEEINFYKIALQRGFYSVPLPQPVLGICGAVALNSYVIDPKGNLYKCWNSIGRVEEKVGNIFNDNLLKWLLYNPLENNECRECNVLPLCMGGCPDHIIQNGTAKCNSIRYNAKEITKLIYEIKKTNKEKSCDEHYMKV